MIGFARSGSTIYPEVRVVNCDNAGNWSPSTLVRASSSYVGVSPVTLERWGDYTGTSRKHNSTLPSIWMNGMFGTTNNAWNTWIAEIHDNSTTGIQEVNNNDKLKVYPNPVSETFSVAFNLERDAELSIQVVDLLGHLVKDLYKGRATSGDNVFSFNKSNLSSGTYFLIFKSNANTFKNEKIIISN